MKLRFLYIKHYRTLSNCQLNFCGGMCFRYVNGVLQCESSAGLPGNFYHLDQNASGRVSEVTMIVGENGTGKTSIAVALDEIFSNPSTDQFEYICVFESSGDQVHSELRYMHNLKEGLKIDPDIESRFGKHQHNHYPQLIYSSPYYSYRINVFRQREQGEPGSTSIDVSSTRYINDAIVGEAEVYKNVSGSVARTLTPDGAKRVLVLRREEIKREIDVCAYFGEKVLTDSRHEFDMPCPDEVVISIDSDYIDATLNALAVNWKKNARSPMRAWYEDAVRAFTYAKTSDFILRLISILQGNAVTNYATQREFRGAYSYNDRWVEYGLQVLTLIVGKEQRNVRATWEDLTFEEKDLIRNKAIDLLETMFRDFHDQGARHVEIAKLLRRLNERMYDESSYLECCIAGEEPETLGEAISLTLKISDKQDRKLIYGLLGVFYTSDNGRFALDVEFSNMSSGEMAYLSLFAKLYEGLKDIDNRDVVIFLDEAETTLHPVWQRKLLYNMIWFVEKFSKGKSVHLVFASHSTMLLSDVPKQNVILLQPKDRGGKRQGEIAQYWNALDNTFGANVFDLMRLPFGLDDGVMGLWAKKKLDGLIDTIEQQHQLSGDDLAVARLFGNRFIQGYLSKWYETDSH